MGRQMRKPNMLWLAGLLGLIVLVGYAPSAHADLVLFGCDSVGSSAPACSGTITTSAGPNFSTSNTVIFNLTSEYLITDAFTLSFNTATGAISMTDGTAAGTMTGTIMSFTSGPGFSSGLTNFSAVVSWSSLPSAVCATVGATAPCAGTGTFTSVTFQISNATAEVVHVGIQPIPEPGSLALFGSGLVVVGAVLRRRIASLISRS
jgi:hypothetical protein